MRFENLGIVFQSAINIKVLAQHYILILSAHLSLHVTWEGNTDLFRTKVTLLENVKITETGFIPQLKYIQLLLLVFCTDRY